MDATPQFTGSAVHYDVDICAIEEVEKKKGAWQKTKDIASLQASEMMAYLSNL